MFNLFQVLITYNIPQLMQKSKTSTSGCWSLKRHLCSSASPQFKLYNCCFFQKDCFNFLERRPKLKILALDLYTVHCKLERNGHLSCWAWGILRRRIWTKLQLGIKHNTNSNQAWGTSNIEFSVLCGWAMWRPWNNRTTRRVDRQKSPWNWRNGRRIHILSIMKVTW